MKYRLYGEKPYRLFAIHGGPGAPGSVSTLARGLSCYSGCIEAFQTKNSISESLEELKEQIAENYDKPAVLFGHSWGAWLVYLFAHKYPDMVKKIFLISSGAFEQKYVDLMLKRRLDALQNDEKKEYMFIINELKTKNENSSELIIRLGMLASKADNYEVEEIEENREAIIDIKGGQYSALWNEGAALRLNGYFKKIASEILCPVVVIHGDNDSTPINGVIEPLEGRLQFLKFYSINKAGHNPWKEKYGKDIFWKIVKAELNFINQ